MRDGKADRRCLEIVQAGAWVNFLAALVLWCCLARGLDRGCCCGTGWEAPVAVGFTLRSAAAIC